MCVCSSLCLSVTITDQRSGDSIEWQRGDDDDDDDPPNIVEKGEQTKAEFFHYGLDEGPFSPCLPLPTFPLFLSSLNSLD